MFRGGFFDSLLLVQDVSAESILVSDSSPIEAKLAKLDAAHRTDGVRGSLL